MSNKAKSPQKMDNANQEVTFEAMSIDEFENNVLQRKAEEMEVQRRIEEDLKMATTRKELDAAEKELREKRLTLSSSALTAEGSSGASKTVLSALERRVSGLRAKYSSLLAVIKNSRTERARKANQDENSVLGSTLVTKVTAMGPVRRHAIGHPTVPANDPIAITTSSSSTSSSSSSSSSAKPISVSSASASSTSGQSPAPTESLVSTQMSGVTPSHHGDTASSTVSSTNPSPSHPRKHHHHHPHRPSPSLAESRRAYFAMRASTTVHRGSVPYHKMGTGRQSSSDATSIKTEIKPEPQDDQDEFHVVGRAPESATLKSSPSRLQKRKRKDTLDEDIDDTDVRAYQKRLREHDPCAPHSLLEKIEAPLGSSSPQKPSGAMPRTTSFCSVEDDQESEGDAEMIDALAEGLNHGSGDPGAQQPQGSSSTSGMSEQPQDGGEEEEIEFDGGLKMHAKIFDKLFVYQQVCVKWLWELHMQNVGGIIGDEMGLGKTIELIAFLEALRYSKMLTGPILIVCPATLLNQWLRELREWAYQFRVIIYHNTSSGTKNAATDEDRMKVLADAQNNPQCVVLTTYSTMRLHHDPIMAVSWHYAILDEGHLIKNPDSEMSLACKSLLTPHRLILSGSPIQNNLTELWSLFDFVYPGRLGTLPVFQAQFAVPIDAGGYANASEFQVRTAYHCAVALCRLIQPFLLRRLKKDVNARLPGKTEQVVFCKLTDEQVVDYANFLQSEDVQRILRRGQSYSERHGVINVAFRSIMVLRKICNHPNLILYNGDEDATVSTELVDSIDKNGRLASSGKMQVVAKLLRQWKAEGHKVLIFSQTRLMLDIIQRFVASQNYSHCRLDGNVPIKNRLHLIDKFNQDPGLFVCLLTSKVGGVGINLVGASRVIIYDPDWNPTTDLQARERAWRIGQRKDVAIYRLMCSGTIEEKIYHRQIFKQFLTEKILDNPDQNRFFKQKDLMELFQLGTIYDETLTRLYKEDNQGHLPREVKFAMLQRKRARQQQTSPTTQSTPTTPLETVALFGKGITASSGSETSPDKGGPSKASPLASEELVEEGDGQQHADYFEKIEEYKPPADPTEPHPSDELKDQNSKNKQTTKHLLSTLLSDGSSDSPGSPLIDAVVDHDVVLRSNIRRSVAAAHSAAAIAADATRSVAKRSAAETHAAFRSADLDWPPWVFRCRWQLKWHSDIGLQVNPNLCGSSIPKWSSIFYFFIIERNGHISTISSPLRENLDQNRARD